MTNHRMTGKLWTLFKRAGWAPLAVLLFHQLVGRMGWRDGTDWLLHSLGGLSIAFFAFHAIPILLDPERRLSSLAHFVFAFCAASTAALVWELAEFASDVLFGTQIQHTIHETMMDLVCGTIGASVTIAVLAVVKFSRRA
jgi:uncharacterized membrane protein YjdF